MTEGLDSPRMHSQCAAAVVEGGFSSWRQVDRGPHEDTLRAQSIVDEGVHLFPIGRI